MLADVSSACAERALEVLRRASGADIEVADACRRVVAAWLLRSPLERSQIAAVEAIAIRSPVAMVA